MSHSNTDNANLKDGSYGEREARAFRNGGPGKSPGQEGKALETGEILIINISKYSFLVSIFADLLIKF